MDPSAFRNDTRIVEVRDFTREQIRTWIRQLEEGACGMPMTGAC